MNSDTSSELYSASSTVPRLIPVSDWPKYHPWPPIGGLRHIIFNAKSNGFARAIKRVGRNVLIDEVAFFEVINEKNEGAK